MDQRHALIDYDISCALCGAAPGERCVDELARQPMPFQVGHAVRAREVDPATGKLLGHAIEHSIEDPFTGDIAVTVRLA